MHEFGEVDAVISEKLYVVYEPGTGEIQHTHRVVTLEGGSEPSDEQDADRAISLARARPEIANLQLKNLEFEVLNVPVDALEPGHRYRVDHQNKSLVPRE